MQLSDNDLLIMKEALLHFWEEYRPGGDETDLYERILEGNRSQIGCPERLAIRLEFAGLATARLVQANVNKMLQEEEDGI